jgi:hypothetical protein
MFMLAVTWYLKVLGFKKKFCHNYQKTFLIGYEL